MFCKTIFFGEEPPTPTFPNGTLAGLAEICACPAAAPEPLRAIESAEFDALLAMVMFPEALPVVAGANCAVNVAPWPAEITSGVVRPMMLKPVPVVVAPETVTLAFPELLSVTVCLPVLPTVTAPKTALAGVALKVELCVTPLPDNMIACGDPAALSVREMLPVLPPVAVGVNCALNVTVWPAAIVVGKVKPLIPNALPDTEARFTTTLLALVFVNVIGCVPLCPTITFPKLTVAGEIASPGCAPIPTSATDNGEFIASLVTVKPPEAEPADSGANWI